MVPISLHELNGKPNRGSWLYAGGTAAFTPAKLRLTPPRRFAGGRASRPRRAARLSEPLRPTSLSQRVKSRPATPQNRLHLPRKTSTAQTPHLKQSPRTRFLPFGISSDSLSAMERQSAFRNRSKRYTLLLVSMGAAIFLTAHAPAQESAAPNPDAAVPVAPVLPFEFQGWTNAFRLANTNLEMVVVPALGRIMSLRYRGGENLLRFDPALVGSGPDRKSPQWINAGGEWLWPMAQSAWPQIAESDWPPPEALADTPWTATAWTATDGSMNCMLTRQYGRPLYIKVSRTIRLAPEKPEFTIRQRMERTRKADTPTTFWNLFQIAAAEKVIIPADEASAFDNGFRPMMFDAPPTGQIHACPGAVVYETSAGEHKLCSDSKSRWIAALKNGVWIVVRARHAHMDGPQPDGGCTLEMYSNAGLGYTEIETLSPETILEDNAAAQNELSVQIIEISRSDDACRAAQELRRVMGDVPPETPAGPPREETRAPDAQQP
jgi:hypothetical protein